MKGFVTLLALLLTLPVMASAQPPDPGAEMSAYTRFLVYPHLQKGLESMRRGERDRALVELERARSLAPDNTAVALYLAAAYRQFGKPERAESLLLDQLTRTPRDARVTTALADLRASAPPPAAVVRDDACAEAVRPPCPEVPPLTEPRAGGTPPTPSSRRSAAPRPSGSPRGPVPPPLLSPPRQLTVQVAPADPTVELRASFAEALQTDRFDVAQRQADLLLAHGEGGAALLDGLTYQLVAAGASEQAIRVLLRTYPFTGRVSIERDALLQRLVMAIGQQRGAATDERWLPLRTPLDTPALRSRQAAFWASLDDCGAIRTVLSDRSPEYGHDDWMRLGDCSIADPVLAQAAYARAYALQPDGRAARGLAYQAYAAGDFGTSLEAWRSIGGERLASDELLAAVTTALSAHEDAQAADWLKIYGNRGEALDHRYWSLRAQSARDDPAAATAALERAIAVHPEVDDYLRLAGFAADFGRQVYWLERAADLDPDLATTQAELGYAYARAGQSDGALHAFERAAALDPSNMNVQIELGYTYWRLGRAEPAGLALERAWHADPANRILAQQLVYVQQRLKHNKEARWYAEQVLDASSPSREGSTDEGADAGANRRFGFQRLHEDLGRRLTVNLDGFSGTSVGTGTSAFQAGSQYRSYSQFEADVRLGNPPIRDGSTLSAYARVLADGGQLSSAIPSQNAMLGVGLRWKPLRDQVIYLAVENQHGLDDHRQDVLLRASGSFLNGGRYGDDWHASGAGWFSRNVYIDAAHYLQTDHSAFTVDYRESYHRKMWASQTLEPYGHLQLNGAKDQRLERDIRSGVGLRWNVWYGATEYDAAPHKVSVGIEFQQAFKTYLTDHNGLFLTLGTRW